MFKLAHSVPFGTYIIPLKQEQPFNLEYIHKISKNPLEYITEREAGSDEENAHTTTKKYKLIGGIK